MKKLATLLLTLVLCLSLAVGLSACGGGSEEGGSDGDSSTLIIATQEEISGTDVQQLEWDTPVHQLITEPLVVFNEDVSAIEPGVAESFEITDDYIEFVLPEGLQFPNGDPLDANAVKASFERYMEISPYASDLDAVKDVEVVNDTTVRLNLSGPAPYMMTSIASIYSGIVDVKVADEVGAEEFNRSAMTYGPYYVESWEQGSQITLKKNENFQTNNPAITNKNGSEIETVIVRFIPDEFTRVSELQSGEVDIAYDIPTSSLADLEADENVTMLRYLQPGVSYLRLNVDNAPTSDIKVRQALTKAINRDELVDNLDGVVTPAYTMISAAMTGYSADEDAKMAEELKYDPDGAKALLAEAGWTDSDGDGIVDKDGEALSFEMNIPSDRASLKDSGSVLQKQFAEIGVDAQIREAEADYNKQLMKDNTFTMCAHTFVWADSDILMSVFSDMGGFAYNNDELNAVFEKARVINDPEERVKAYEEATEILQADYMGIPLFSDNYIIGTKSNVEGLIITNDGRSWFHDVTK